MVFDLGNLTFRHLWQIWLIDVTAANVSIALIAMLCIGSYLWGVRAHFRQDGAMPLGMRIIALASVGGYLVMLGLLLVNSASAISKVLGTALMLLSLAIFWWAVGTTRGRNLALAYSIDSPASLVHDGPYRFVRHPFYLSYLCFWVAGVVATATSAFGVMFFLMLALYLRAALMEEAKFLGSPLENSYRQFQAETGMFLPRLK